MDHKKLVKGNSYYCLVGDSWCLTMAVIKVEYVGPANYKYNDDLVFVDHDIDGYIHRFGVDTKDLYPPDKTILKAVLHNERRTRQVIEHPKQFDHANAREFVFKWFATLLETDQKALVLRFRELYPSLVKDKYSGPTTNIFLTSKFKMKHWTELMHGYFDYKFPRVDVPEF